METMLLVMDIAALIWLMIYFYRVCQRAAHDVTAWVGYANV